MDIKLNFILAKNKINNKTLKSAYYKSIADNII